MGDRYDVAVIGAGAAGMMCAAVAGQRGRSVVLLDHAERLAEKIRISGGGRCNFTNCEVGHRNFLSENPDFARGVLSRYGSSDFVDLVMRHRIPFHEKHRGQLFCDDSSESIIRMLVAECDAGGVDWRRPAKVRSVAKDAERFVVATDAGSIEAPSVVIATGGLSIPKIGATDFAFRIARQFGHRVVEPRPALVPLTFDAATWAPFVPLAGIATEVDIRSGEGRFREDLLLTHRGLSGPATLQISSYWAPGTAITIDLAPGVDLAAALEAERAGSRRTVANALASHLPARLATTWAARFPEGRRIAELSKVAVRELAESLSTWRIVPDGTEGYRKAEVTAGGVDTRELSQKSLESRRVPGLYFIGEAVDMTGWLGGYNFQWAWSSGYVAGQAA